MKARVPLFLIFLVSSAAFAFAQEAGSAAKSTANPVALPPPLSGTGTTNHIAKWLTSTSIGNSGIFESSTGLVGIGTGTPATKFDVKGTGDFRDSLTLFPNSTHPALFISGTAFQIGSTGKVSFVAGQTFPGTGTVSTVNSGPGLIGGPIHTTGTLGIATGGVTNAMLNHSSLNVSAGTGLSGGGAVTLGGNVTLSVNQTVVPLLANANAFTKNQTILGDLFVNIVFGTGVSLNGSSATSMGAGNNPTPGLGGNSLTVTGGGAAVGATDAGGGDLILAAGDGTGAGGSGNVRIQAAAAGSSGTSADTLVDRQLFAPKSASMGGQNGTASVFVLNPANGDGAGATLRFTINANDGGGNVAAETGTCVIALSVLPDGSGSSIALRFGTDSVDTGGVNASCDIIPGNVGNENGIAVSDSLSFAPTTHVIYFEIDNVSGSPLVTLLPGARPGRRLNQRVNPLHPSVQVRRNR